MPQVRAGHVFRPTTWLSAEGWLTRHGGVATTREPVCLRQTQPGGGTSQVVG